MNIKPTDFKNAQLERKPSGYIIIDGQEVAHTLQCCHCNAHFISIKGSGKRRGFCLKCYKTTCGNPNCDVCVPFEARLDFTDSKNSNVIKRLLSRYPKIKTV